MEEIILPKLIYQSTDGFLQYKQIVIWDDTQNREAFHIFLLCLSIYINVYIVYMYTCIHCN